MGKVIISEEILSNIIQNSIKKTINESEYDEGLRDSLGKAFGAVKRGVQNGLGWVRDKVSQIGNNAYGGSQSYVNQKGNTHTNTTKNTNSKYGPQPFPELSAQVSNEQGGKTQGGGEQKQYTQEEIVALHKQLIDFINQKKKDGYKYEAVKSKNGKMVKKFTSGPDRTKLRAINGTLTRLCNKWRIAAGYGKRMNKIIEMITKDVINEILKLQ